MGVPSEEKVIREVSSTSGMLFSINQALAEVLVDPDWQAEGELVSTALDRDARIQIKAESRPAEAVVSATDEISEWDPVQPASEADRHARCRQEEVGEASTGRINVRNRQRHTGETRGRYVRDLARAQQVGAEQIGVAPGEYPAVCLGLQQDAPAAVPELNGLVHRSLNN
jgi:hypothetical protein